MKPAPFVYHRPGSVSDALAILKEDNAAVMAGGQSLIPMMGLRLAFFDTLVDIRKISELRSVVETKESIFVGAAVTHSAIEDGQIADPSRGLMARVASKIAYRAVRNQGTIGGSIALADPAADWPACLMALDAVAVLSGVDGERRVQVCDFVTGAYMTDIRQGELILGFEIPRLRDDARWAVYKVARKSGAFATSLAIAVIRPSLRTANVVLTGTSSHAQKLPAISEYVAGGGNDENELRARASQDLDVVDPAADAYARRCHTATILRAVKEAQV